MPLDMPKVRSGIKEAISKLSEEGGHDAAEAIMTTDLVLKEIAVEFEIQGQKVRMGAMAKGSGMIHPNMATMIGVITTDANISRELLDKALKDVISILSTGYRLTETPVFATWLSSLPTEKQTMKILSRRILTIPLSNPPLNTSVHTFPK